MRRLAKYLYLIGPILFCIILYSLDKKKVYEIFTTVNFSLILLGLALMLIESLVRADKLRRLISVHEKFTFLNAIKAHLIGVSFGAVTPSGLGGLAKLEMVKKGTKLNYACCLSAVVVDKLINLLSLVLIGILALLIALFRLSGIRHIFFPFLVVLSCLALIFAGLLKMESRMYTIFLRVVWRVAQKRLKNNNKISFANSRLTVEALSKERKSASMIIALSFFSWFMLLTRAYIYTRSLGIQVAFTSCLFIFPLAMLVELIPVSILGIGTRDITLIFLFSNLGIDKAYAVSLSLICLVLLLMFEVPTGFVVAYREYLK